MEGEQRIEVTFESDGTPCSGWFFPAAAASDTPTPGVVMAHGFTGVKEMDLEPFAEAFALAGLAVLLFDYRGFGTSGGEPRQYVDPRKQLDDYRNALSWLGGRRDVDADRLGAWGTSYSGGHVLHLAAYDRRVKAVVSQVPFVDGWNTAIRVVGAEAFQAMRQALADEELRLFAGAPPVCVPVVAEPGAPAAIPQAGTSAHLLEAAEHAPSWRNEITLSSLGRLIEYAPGNSIEHISPTPLLMLIAGDDVLTPPDLALAAYNRALEPKQLAFIETDVHHGVYDEPARGDAIAAARDWFTRHLLSGADVPVGAQER